MRRTSFLLSARLCVLCVSAVLLAGVADGQGRRRRAPASEDREEVSRLIEKLTGRIESRPGSISSVLSAYNDIERRKTLDLDGRYRLHRSLLEALREVDDPALARAAASLLRTPSKSRLAAQVLMMKALVAETFPAPRVQRVEWMARAARSSDDLLSTWGHRLLGESGWPESVDVLIGLLGEEEANGRGGGTRWQLASRELYRVLGGRTAYAMTAGEVQAEWERRGKRVPESPEYTLDTRGGRASATAAFFGDRVSPRSVFLIDVSRSMEQIVTVRSSRSPRSSGTTASPGEQRKRDRGEALFGRTSPKIDIVKKELERAISALRPQYEFNILRYSDRAMPWRTVRGRLELVEADEKNVAAAVEFARALRPDSGTNIFEALDQALGIPDVDTIYLLSDGAPSVGGDVRAIERNVARKNYLKGARIVTYGFTPERRGLFDDRFGFDEDFMKSVAASNWGWYRRLNQARSRGR